MELFTGIGRQKNGKEASISCCLTPANPPCFPCTRKGAQTPGRPCKLFRCHKTLRKFLPKCGLLPRTPYVPFSTLLPKPPEDALLSALKNMCILRGPSHVKENVDVLGEALHPPAQTCLLYPFQRVCCYDLFLGTKSASMNLKMFLPRGLNDKYLDVLGWTRLHHRTACPR